MFHLTKTMNVFPYFPAKTLIRLFLHLNFTYWPCKRVFLCSHFIDLISSIRMQIFSILHQSVSLIKWTGVDVSLYAWPDHLLKPLTFLHFLWFFTILATVFSHNCNLITIFVLLFVERNNIPSNQKSFFLLLN